MLTELEEEYGIDDVVQDEPEMSDEQRAILAANNLGMDLLSIPTKVTGGEVIEILDDNEEDVMNEYEREEVLVKIEPDQMIGATTELESNTRRSGRIKIANRQLEDYELYTTVEEEEQMMLATLEENPADDEEDEEVLAAVAHFVMVQYKQKEGIVNDGSKSKGKDHWYTLDEWCAPPRMNRPRSERLVLIARRKGGSLLPRAVPKRAATGPESEASACCYARNCKIRLQR